MLTELSNFLKPPVFPADEDKTRKARYAHAITLAFLVVVIAFETVVRFSENYFGLSIMDMILGGLAALCIACLIFLKQGRVQLTSILLVSLIWIASNSIAATGFGAKDASYITNFAIVLMAGLLLGWQASLVVTVLSILSGFTLAYAERSGLIEVAFYPITSFARDIVFVFGLNGVLMFLLINGLENALRRSRSHLAELERANETLNATQTELSDRSADLLTANSLLEDRTKKLRAVAQITRTATTLREFDELLSSIPGIVSNQLGYYHVGIFLLDEQKQYAILRAANTGAGLMLVSQRHRVPVGQLGLVSSVAQTGQARIATTLSADNADLGVAELADTRSELALPLKSGDEIVGVLDIQSQSPNDFSADDISTLSILADQVGIALKNALLFESSQRALREANLESTQTAQRAWKEYADSIRLSGYRYDGIKAEPLKNQEQASRRDETLLIPVQLRGQTIGRLRLNPSERSHAWTEDELLMVRATAERVALALEGTRLLEEAQRRATREAFLSDVASKLSSSFQLDSILRDTVQELGESFKNATVTFQLVDPAGVSSASDPKKQNGSARE